MANLRVVCDTNVYISAALRGGQAEVVIRLAAARAIDLVTSPAILAELEDKLLDRFGWSQQQADLFLDTLRMIAEVVEPALTLAVVEDDPDDNRILECAQSGRAALVVTYDRHLLRLRRYNLIGIVHPNDLLRCGLGRPSDAGLRSLEKLRNVSAPCV